MYMNYKIALVLGKWNLGYTFQRVEEILWRLTGMGDCQLYEAWGCQEVRGVPLASLPPEPHPCIVVSV